MKTKAILLGCGLLLASGVVLAQAPSWSGEQQAVWKTVQETWQKDQEKDLSWMERQILPVAAMWHEHTAVPRPAGESRRWAAFYNEHYDMLIHAVTPLAISIDGDTAVAHYAWHAVYAQGEDKEHENGRCTDTLVRRDGQWRFLGWSCAELGGE